MSEVDLILAFLSGVVMGLVLDHQISSEDRMIHPDNERRMSGRLGAARIITLDASHASLASRPVEVSALIDEAATATTTVREMETVS